MSYSLVGVDESFGKRTVLFFSTEMSSLPPS